MAKIKGVLIDVENCKVSAVEVERKCSAYYKILNCDLIDIATRKIGGTYFDIICDDEGLLKDGALISAMTPETDDGYMVGNLFIVGTPDDDGNSTSLTDDEIKLVMANVFAYVMVDNGEVTWHPVVHVEF